MSPIHRSVDGHPGNTQDGPSDDLSIHGQGCYHHRGPTPLSRSDPVLDLSVHAKDLFVAPVRNIKSHSSYRRGNNPAVERTGFRYASLPSAAIRKTLSATPFENPTNPRSTYAAVLATPG